MNDPGERSLHAWAEDLRSSDAEVRISDTVFAIGSPLDEALKSTVTRGVVSAFRHLKHRGMDYIQADVDIQSGNSGGPLVDANGNVVGITVLGIGDRSIGLNFFIPISEALEFLKIDLDRRDDRTS